MIVVTGGLGFIGSNYVRAALKQGERVIVVDALTYAARLENVADCWDGWMVFADFGTLPRRCSLRVERSSTEAIVYLGSEERRDLSYRHLPAYSSVESAKQMQEKLRLWQESESRLLLLIADVATMELWPVLLEQASAIVHFAAETHVDRSIISAEPFLYSDLHGTYAILEAIRRSAWRGRLLHVSTDEVYGEAGDHPFTEDAPMLPRNPYSVAKASADRMVAAFVHTYGVDAVIVRPSNNFGPYQYPEKLIPLITVRALLRLYLPVYGDGLQMREWLFVRDCVAGVRAALERGRRGEAYNLGGGKPRHNLEVVERVLQLLERPRDLIRHVADRPGHDRKYWLDFTKAKSELGWEPQTDFAVALAETVYWYRDNPQWWRPVLERDPDYRRFIDEWYSS